MELCILNSREVQFFLSQYLDFHNILFLLRCPSAQARICSLQAGSLQSQSSGELNWKQRLLGKTGEKLKPWEFLGYSLSSGLENVY